MKTLELNEISINSLTEAFEAAVIACEIDKDRSEIYLSEGLDFPFWLSINDKKKWIKFFTCIKAKEGVTEEELMAFARRLNEEYITVRFTIMKFEDGRMYLNGDYFIFTAFGLLVAQLVHTAKNFSEVFIHAIRKEDVDESLFS